MRSVREKIFCVLGTTVFWIFKVIGIRDFDTATVYYLDAGAFAKTSALSNTRLWIKDS